MNRTLLLVISGWMVGLGALSGLLAEPSSAPKSESKPAVELPEPPARIADAAVQAKACVQCHEEIADLLEGTSTSLAIFIAWCATARQKRIWRRSKRTHCPTGHGGAGSKRKTASSGE